MNGKKSNLIIIYTISLESCDISVDNTAVAAPLSINQLKIHINLNRKRMPSGHHMLMARGSARDILTHKYGSTSTTRQRTLIT